NGESTSSTKTNASARTIFPPLSGLCAPVNFRPVKQYSNESASGPISTISTAGGSQAPHLSSAHHCGPESHPLQRRRELAGRPSPYALCLVVSCAEVVRRLYVGAGLQSALFAFLSVVADLQIGSLFFSLL